MLSSSSSNNSLDDGREQELTSPSTPSPSSSSNNSFNDQLSSYREKHRAFKEKKKNQDMASLTAFLIASKYEPQVTLPSSGLERYFPKDLGFCGKTPTNATRSNVSFRASNVRGRGLPTVQPGSWFKPSVQGEEYKKEELAVKVAEDESTPKEEVILNSISSTSQSISIPRI